MRLQASGSSETNAPDRRLPPRPRRPAHPLPRSLGQPEAVSETAGTEQYVLVVKQGMATYCYMPMRFLRRDLP